MKKDISKYITVIMILVFIILTTGCFLASTDTGSSYLSISANSSALRGYYGDVGDVQYIDVYVFRDPDRTVDTTESGSTDDELLAHHVLSSGNGWSTTFMDVPTLTTLRIEAYAKGNPDHDYTNEIGWDPVENTGESDVIMFDGNSYLYLTSATASVYLSMRQYNDGFLERFPRLNKLTTDLDDPAELRIDFNSYGEVTWADDSQSYETWYWRIIEMDSSVASAAFSISSVDGMAPAGGESTFPEGSYRFNEVNSAEDYGDNLILNYLFPNYDSDMEVDWYQHGYVLEVVNPQHNVLRQQFVINPGIDTGFSFNFAPFIRNITAQRSFPYLNQGIDEVTFGADVVDPEGGSIRYLWIMDLNLPGGSPLYNGVAGDLYGDSGAACLSDAKAMINALNTPADESALNDSDYTGFYALASQYVVSTADYAAVASDDRLYDTAGSGVVIPSKEKLIIPGPVFDSALEYTGELYLMVFDEVWGTSDSLDRANSIYQNHEDAMTFIKMSINQDSFPNTSLDSGLFVFE
jgi:hypothetical protein